MVIVFARLPEWSKGADLRSAMFACVGSNPTPCVSWSHSVMAITEDFEFVKSSSDLSSILSGT